MCVVVVNNDFWFIENNKYMGKKVMKKVSLKKIHRKIDRFFSSFFFLSSPENFPLYQEKKS